MCHQTVGLVAGELERRGIATTSITMLPGITRRVRTPRAPYTTRMIVRRPIKRTRMSGTVVVEPLNPSNLFDLNIGWALSGDQFMRNGDVWVGFTWWSAVGRAR